MPRRYRDPPPYDDRFDGRDGYYRWNEQVCHDYYRNGFCEREAGGRGCWKEHLEPPGVVRWHDCLVNTVQPQEQAGSSQPQEQAPSQPSWVVGVATSGASSSSSQPQEQWTLVESSDLPDAYTKKKDAYTQMPKDAQTQTTELPDAYTCPLCCEGPREYALRPCFHFGFCLLCIHRGANGGRYPERCFICKTPCVGIERVRMI